MRPLSGFARWCCRRGFSSACLARTIGRFDENEKQKSELFGAAYSTVIFPTDDTSRSLRFCLSLFFFYIFCFFFFRYRRLSRIHKYSLKKGHDVGFLSL